MSMIIATDLEGVLIPEIWEEVGERYGIDELMKTTREMEDFKELMEHRIEVLRQEDLKLPDIQKVAREVMAYPGSIEFLSWARRQGQVMIISDTFHELSDELIWEMGGYNLFANRFITNDEGYITGFRLRIRGRKWRVLEKLRESGFFIAAIGDSYNDLSMLKRADHPMLINPPEDLTEEHPEIPVKDSYDDIRESILSLPDNAADLPVPSNSEAVSG
ncbi:MAG: bifunctional phosphoserine phosphatase/homoserine phosphotransferase ThrH [bacterium]